MLPVLNHSSSVVRALISRSFILAIAFAMLAVNTASAKEPFSAALDKAVNYQGYVVDQNGKPVSGKHKLKLRYLDLTGSELVTESFVDVKIDDKGRFNIQLGTGKVSQPSQFDSVATSFAAHPKLNLEVSINGVVQAPLVGILPAGHSLKSRLIAASDDGKGDDDAHWKHYKKKTARLLSKQVH